METQKVLTSEDLAKTCVGKFIGFESVDYHTVKNFGRHAQNRMINRGHLGGIKKGFLENFDIMPPIIVNVVTNNVLDGQHRRESYLELVEKGYMNEDGSLVKLSKDMLLKVMLVEISVEDELDAIIKYNTNSKTWSLDDFIECHTQSGNLNYRLLKEWCLSDDHLLTFTVNKNDPDGRVRRKPKYRYGAAMLKGKNCSNDLKRGDFVINEGELQNAELVYSGVQAISSTMNKKGKGPWIENLAIAWHGVKDLHPFEIWMREITNRSKTKKISSMPTDNIKDWEDILSQIHLGIDKKNK